MRIISLICLTLLLTVSASGQQTTQEKEWQNTWTYTYLKAKENQQENLKQFVIKNWFVMDSIAVRKGLFNDYRLLENKDASSDRMWDFIVAVEYYTKGTYSDIQEEWKEIRNNHTNVLIEGYSFPELGGVVKSEEMAMVSRPATSSCDTQALEMIAPFIGHWYEYETSAENKDPYGNLSIRLSSVGCSLRKEFSMLTSSFSYTTLGYYDLAEKTWIETYSFSNGAYAVYEWKMVDGEIILVLTESSFGSKELKRNRWTNVKDNSFSIIAEKSMDGGANWEVTSTTELRRAGD